MPRRPSHGHGMAFDDGLDPMAGPTREAVDRSELRTFAPRERRDRPRHGMLARVLCRACEAHELRAVDAVTGHDADDCQRPFGHGAGLIEHDRRDPPRLLEDLGPSDQDPELRPASRPDHQRGRRREPECTRARDDQHRDGGGERRGDIAREEEPAGQRRERQSDHDRHEDGRDAVDEPLDRCLAGLRIRHETGDLGQGGVVTDLRRLDHEPARAC